jgi:hypothetical protein
LETDVYAYYQTDTGEFHQDKARHLNDRKNKKGSKLVEIRQAIFRTVPIQAIKGVIWAVPDCQMFDEYERHGEDVAHITVVKDRLKYWANNFF